MSFSPGITPRITLLDATQLGRTIFPVKGDSSEGNLTRFRKQGSYTFTGVQKSRHGSITLRAKDSLFIKNEPTLIKPEDFAKYLIEVQFFQHTKTGEVGHPNATGRVGEVVRYEISEPVQDVDEKGEILTITLTALENRLRESFDSETHILRTPKQSFMNRINHYGDSRGPNAPLIYFATSNEIELPDNDFLKQDWIVGGPKSTHDLIVDIIHKLAQPAVTGGNFKDQYFYFVNDPTVTKTVRVLAEEYGKTTGPVVLDATRPTGKETYEKKHTMITANKSYKNLVIVLGATGAHDWPMDYSRFASDFEHAKIAANWSSVITYRKNDYVQNVNKLYKSKVDSNLNNIPPISGDNTFWINLSDFTKHSPLTTDIDLWKSMMSGFDPMGDGYYVGCFVDINIVNPNYDRTKPTDEFESIATKDFDHLVNDPSAIPVAEIHMGKRALVGTAPTGAFAGHANQIAQYFDNGIDVPVWKFSRNPVTNEIINDRRQTGFSAGLNVGARQLRWDGTAWVAHWGFNVTDAGAQTSGKRASAFHPVESISLVPGPDNVPNTAVQFVFNWNDTGTTTHGKIGRIQNRASRWAGFSLRIPIVPRAQGLRTVGDLMKTPTLDFENLSRNLKDNAVANYNSGILTEDLSTLRGIAGKLNFDFRDASDNMVNGFADMTARFWFRDLQDHRVYTDTTIRVSSEFVPFHVDVGPDAHMQLHDDRTSELYKAFGITFPHNFFIKEKEYSGIVFDWRHVKEMGVMFMGSYDQNTFYTGAEGNFLDKLAAVLAQIFDPLRILLGQPYTPANYIVDVCKLKVAELRFKKDAIVLSSDIKVSDARAKIVNASNHFDYVTMKNGIAEGELQRAQHYPQWTPIDAYPDVRLRIGQNFVAQGARWQGSPRTMVCAEYTLHEGENGVRMQVLGYNKFEGGF